MVDSVTANSVVNPEVKWWTLVFEHLQGETTDSPPTGMAMNNGRGRRAARDQLEVILQLRGQEKRELRQCHCF